MNGLEFMAILGASGLIIGVCYIVYGWWIEYKFKKEGKAYEPQASDSCM